MGRNQFTEHQLELLALLWEHGPSTVQAIHQALPPERGIAQATVATMLNRMCKDQALERVRVGRQFEYRAKIRREELQQSMLSRILDKLFQGDAAALLSHLVREDQVSSDDLQAAQALLKSEKNKDSL